ncbi:hypothetical protein GCM10027258_79560 [Amycolatopsis stemonae]
MGSQHEQMPPWLVASLDQLDAGARDFNVRSRTGFEKMVRGRAHDEREVAEAMAWYDTTQGHLDAALATALGGPGTGTAAPATSAPPQPEPYAHDTFDDDDAFDEDEYRVPEPRLRIPELNFELPDAPDRSTRLLQAPGVYIKGLWIGAMLGGGTWFVLTGLLRWWLDTAWWGWWPGVLTVPIALVVFVWWFATVRRDVKTWVRKGGLKPLRERFKG